MSLQANENDGITNETSQSDKELAQWLYSRAEELARKQDRAMRPYRFALAAMWFALGLLTGLLITNLRDLGEIKKKHLYGQLQKFNKKDKNNERIF